jgi:hypothetical protein
MERIDSCRGNIAGQQLQGHPLAHRDSAIDTTSIKIAENAAMIFVSN